MYIVQWMHDADAAEYEYQYFTRGTVAQQKADAERFARNLGVDPRRGYVMVRQAPSKGIGGWISRIGE